MFSADSYKIGDEPRRNILISCDQGLFVVNRFDNSPVGVASCLLDHGTNNTVEADITYKLLKDVDRPVVLDVGANIGTYTTWIARFIKSRQGVVYCFEPQRLVFQLLCGNLALNNIFNVYPVQIALGKDTGQIEVDEPDYEKTGNFGAFRLDGVRSNQYAVTKQRQHISQVTLDKWVQDNYVPQVDFIKIDTDGLDLDVIYGGLDTIKKHMPSMIVEYINLGSSKTPETSEQGKKKLSDYLIGLGYNCFVNGDNLLATVRKDLKSINYAT